MESVRPRIACIDDALTARAPGFPNFNDCISSHRFTERLTQASPHSPIPLTRSGFARLLL